MLIEHPFWIFAGFWFHGSLAGMVLTVLVYRRSTERDRAKQDTSLFGDDPMESFLRHEKGG